MIKYNLHCNACDRSFDSWFASSKEFEKIKKLKMISCGICGSKKIKKSLMSPNLSNVKKKPLNSRVLKILNIKNKIKNYQKFIKNNLRYVGENFSYEARTIHYNKKKSEKGIYGKATKDEIKELNEEGIITETIPWINDKEN